MAEPELIDVPDLHPGPEGYGVAQLHHYPWRDPGYWVTCFGCPDMASGTTPQEAIDAWNEAHPMRSVAEEENAAVQVARVQPLITEAFLQTLAVVTQVYGEEPDVSKFVDWCHELGGVPRS